MRPCTLRIASAEDDIKATSLDAALVEHAPWCRTTPTALPIHIKPLGRLGDDGTRARRVLEAAIEQADRLVGDLGAERVRVREEQTVREHGLDEPLDVRRLDVLATTEQRHRPGATLERQRAANRGSGAHARQHAGRTNEIDHPALQQRVDVDVLDGVLQRAQVVEPVLAHRLLLSHAYALDGEVTDEPVGLLDRCLEHAPRPRAVVAEPT